MREIVLVSSIAVGAYTLIYLIVRKTVGSRESRPWWHYLLLWPLLFKQEESGGPARSKNFTNRELFGWIVVLLLATLAMVFSW